MLVDSAGRTAAAEESEFDVRVGGGVGQVRTGVQHVWAVDDDGFGVK